MCGGLTKYGDDKGRMGLLQVMDSNKDGIRQSRL